MSLILAQLPSSSDLLANLNKTYTLHNLTIISSSKIYNKVSRVLSLLGLFTPPSPLDDPTKEDSSLDATVIVALSAKASVGSKLITIVEIVKREIARRRDDNAGVEEVEAQKRSPTVFQYSAVKGVVVPQKVNETKRAGNKKRKRDDDPEPLTITEQKEKSDCAEAPGPKTAMTPSPPAAPPLDLSASHAVVDNNELDGDDNDDEAFFETLKHTPAAAALGVDGSKARATPFLTIFLCTQSIKVLKDAYGEQKS